jgi:uncharacterized membrane protein
MASQKQARASGRAKTADKPAQPGTAQTAGARAGSATRDQNRAQDGQGRNTRERTGRTQTSRAQSGQAQSGRARGAGPGQYRPGTATQARPGTQAAGSTGAGRPPAGFTPPLWFQITTLVLALGGLGMSIYLTIAHYTSTSILACSDKGYINCAKVTTSPESIVFGIFPVAVLGMAFYVFMVAITTPWAWRSPLPLIAWARTAGIISGIGFVLYLVYAEVVEIGNICILCTTVHVITFVLFVLLLSVAPFSSKARARSAR